jgi:hypothetical protein
VGIRAGGEAQHEEQAEERVARSLARPRSSSRSPRIQIRMPVSLISTSFMAKPLVYSISFPSFVMSR